MDRRPSCERLESKISELLKKSLLSGFFEKIQRRKGKSFPPFFKRGIKKEAFLLFVIGLLFASSAYASDILIASGHPNYAPFMWREGDKIVGVGSELTEIIFGKIGIKVEGKYVGNWRRVQVSAKHGEVDVITGIYMTDERKTYLVYPPNPYVTISAVVWVWKGKAFKFEKWEDLIGKKGTAVLGESFGKNFDNFIKEKLDIERVPQFILNFKKLEKGRADYMPYGLYPGLIQAKLFGYADKIEYLPTPLYSEGLYIAISKRSKFNKYLHEFEKGIKETIAAGTVDKLIKKYLDYYEETQAKK